MTVAPLSDAQGPGLTDEERAELTAQLADCTMDIRIDPDTVARIALGPTVAANIVESVLPFVRRRVRAASRTALIEAAKAVKDVRENGLPEGVTHAPYAKHFEDWLLDRAATYDAGDDE